MVNLPDSYRQLQQNIARFARDYGREPENIKLLAVSKKQPVKAIQAAYALGQRDFGENYLQEALKKINTIKYSGVAWHFIGPIQANKTRAIAEHFHWVHSVDRQKIAQRLNDARSTDLDKLNICIQVNISGETTKSGVAPSDLPELIKFCQSLPRINLRGLMALPEPFPDLANQRESFKQVRELLEKNNPDKKMDTLSMGTTIDLEAAIAEGATIVRVGTALFGARQ